MSDRQISLLYHDVLPPGAAPGSSGFGGADADIYKLKQSLFEKHLTQIASLEPDRVRVLAKPQLPSLPESAPVLFTFDDGGITADEPTTQLLEKHGWRGHFFIVTERIGQPGFLTRERLTEMRRRGHVIGSHSHTHPARFSRLSYAQMVHEWRRSRELLEEILGEPVWSGSVPGGFYSRDVALAANEAGYRLLFNSEPVAEPAEVGGLLVLGRYGVQHRTTAEAVLRLARADYFPRLRQWSAWNAKKSLKQVGGPYWLAFRKWFFR